MTIDLTALVAHRYVVFTGWTLFMVLWETTLAALGLAMWRLAHHRSSARAHYHAAVTAFVAAVVLAAATPLMLAAVPPASSAIGRSAAARGAAITTARASGADVTANTKGTEPIHRSAQIAVSPDALAGAAAILWAIGVAVLAGRLIGGWILAHRIARRARPVDAAGLTAVLDAWRREAEFASGVAIRQSVHVDAPVVIGWRRPMLILPDEATSLTPDTVAPLLAHEFAHIRRGDYLANLCQSAAELLLFFSPALLWISRRIRETREFCCDDAAVARCGDAQHYARALSTLAVLGAANTARPAVGAAGPRLIVRVRRLLQEEPMPAFSSARIAALVTVTIALLVVGMPISAASAARIPRGDAAPAAAPAAPAAPVAAAAAPRQEFVPYGWETEPDGAGVKLANFVSTAEAPAQSVTVQNVSSAAVVGVQFLAAVEQQLPFPANLFRPPVRLFESELLPVSIPTGRSAAVSPAVLSAEQLQQVAADAGGARIQFFFGLRRVRFANGSEWRITVNRAATSGADAFHIPGRAHFRALFARNAAGRADLIVRDAASPRDLIVRDAASPEVPFGACRDDRNRATSHGGVIPVLNEPGKFMRCQNGRWVDTAVK